MRKAEVRAVVFMHVLTSQWVRLETRNKGEKVDPVKDYISASKEKMRLKRNSAGPLEGC